MLEAGRSGQQRAAKGSRGQGPYLVAGMKGSYWYSMVASKEAVRSLLVMVVSVVRPKMVREVGGWSEVVRKGS